MILKFWHTKKLFVGTSALSSNKKLTSFEISSREHCKMLCISLQILQWIIGNMMSVHTLTNMCYVLELFGQGC